MVEDANTMFSPKNKGTLHNFHEDVGRQGQPKRQDLVLMCPILECKAQERPVSSENRDMKLYVPQVDRCKPITRMDALENAFLREPFEW